MELLKIYVKRRCEEYESDKWGGIMKRFRKRERDSVESSLCTRWGKRENRDRAEARSEQETEKPRERKNRKNAEEERRKEDKKKWRNEEKRRERKKRKYDERESKNREMKRDRETQKWRERKEIPDEMTIITWFYKLLFNARQVIYIYRYNFFVSLS